MSRRFHREKIDDNLNAFVMNGDYVRMATVNKKALSDKCRE